MARSEDDITAVFHELGTEVGAFEQSWSTKKLRQGDLNGNMFEIILRRGREGDSRMQEVCEELNSKQFRFINYFGLQRFGFALCDGSSKHVQVGSSILRREWDKAVSQYLSTDVYMWQFIDRDKLRDFDAYIRSGKWADALRVSKSFGSDDAGSVRIRILKELVRGGSAKDALRLGVPKTLLHLYPASVMSLLWNARAAELECEGGETAGILEMLGAESDDLKRGEYEEVARRYGVEDLVSKDLDLSDDLGFICRMTRVQRPILVTPKNMQATILENGLDLKLEFGLPAGSYASSLLLEVMEPRRVEN
jgi:tRNA(Glu) U13 pseudouridine synthase TruD